MGSGCLLGRLFFSMTSEVRSGGKSAQSFRTPATNKLPEIGAIVELFGWEKWNTHVVEVLDLKELEAKEAIRR
jgi:hypothetical protein